MTFLLINLVLALVWTFLSGDPSLRNFFFGYIFGYIALLPYRRLELSDSYSDRVLFLLRFIAFFLLALIKSSLDVAWEILTPRHHMRPGVVEIDVEGMPPLGVFILANAISLTPGTMTIGISRPGEKLYVHAMYGSNPREVIESIDTLLKDPLLRVIPKSLDPTETLRGTDQAA